MVLIEDFIISGAMTGAAYALLALGFTLIYGVTEILNLSHGAYYMLGAYLFLAFFSNPPKLGVLPSLILAVVFVGLAGVFTYLVFIRPIVEHEITVLVVTLGVALILQYLITINFGSEHTPVAYLLPFETMTLPFLGVELLARDAQKLLGLVVSFVLITGLWIFISKSKIGGAMRATAQDREAAMLMGINTEWLYILTMAISASLAAIAGILITPLEFATPDMWTYPLIISFAVVLLGGLGSIKGSLVGAFIVAYAEQSVLFFVEGGEFLRGAVSLIVMVLVLILRPKGLFGKRLEAER